MIIEVSQTFRDLNLTSQCVELATCFLSLLVLTTNTLCIVQLIRQRGFCLLRNSSPCSYTLLSSLFGSNCLVGATSLIKEILLIFVESTATNSNSKTSKSPTSSSRTSWTILEAWKHFEWYIVIFCLISSSLHIFLIVLTYLIKSLMMSSGNAAAYHHKTVNASARVLDAVFVTLIWVLSLSPAYLQTDDPVRYRQILVYVSLMLLTCCCIQLVLYLLVNWQYRHYKKHLRRKQKQHYKDSRSLSSSPDSIVVATAEHDDNRRSSNLVALTSRRRSRLKRKHRAICVWLIASYLVVSGPYLIYYPVLSKVQQNIILREQQQYQPDVIDSIVFLFVLLKCFCDALVFIVWRGWERDKLKVNFKLNHTEKDKQKSSKSSASMTTTSTTKTKPLPSTPHRSVISSYDDTDVTNVSSTVVNSIARYDGPSQSMQYNLDQTGRDGLNVSGSSNRKSNNNYGNYGRGRDFIVSGSSIVNSENGNGDSPLSMFQINDWNCRDFNGSGLSAVDSNDRNGRSSQPKHHYRNCRNHHHHNPGRNDDTNPRIFVETVVIDGVQQDGSSSNSLPTRISDV